MKNYFTLFIYFIYFISFSQLPSGFGYAKDVITDLNVELRYFTSNNFVGKKIDGYKSNRLILTKEAIQALKNVQLELEDNNLCLKVYDGYRPQRAVDHFINWALDLNDTINKHIYYPNVEKKNLFKEEYIASRSGHSRGSTVDLTIINGNTGEPIDMGSVYDFFGEESWINYNNITDKQMNNRILLQSIMAKHGFRNYTKEWWHFTLRNEPFPNSYFNFEVK